jgi:hypothetical protein
MGITGIYLTSVLFARNLVTQDLELFQELVA